MTHPVVLRVGKHTVRAEWARGGGASVRQEVRYGSVLEWPEAISRLLGDEAFEAAPRTVRVEIEPPLLQRRTLTDIPPVAPTRLKKLIAHQSRTFFKHFGTPLVTDACWVHGPGDRSTAFAVACEEQVAVSIIEAVHGVAWKVASMAPAERPPRSPRLSLLPGIEVDRRRALQRRLAARGLLAAGVILLGLAGILTARALTEIREDRAEISLLRAPVATLQEVRVMMDRAESAVKAVASAQRDRYRIGAVLRAVTVALPDSAFLRAIRLESSGAGWMAGEAQSPPEVVRRLQSDKRTPKPTVRRSGSASATPGWLPFEVSFGGRDST